MNDFSLDDEIVDVASIKLDSSVRSNSGSITGCARRHHPKNSATNFKFLYSSEECKPAPPTKGDFTCKANQESKQEAQNVLGIGTVGYIKDSVYHKRGRSSNHSNQRTFGSQIR